jgi:hypothetical protein
MTKVKAILILSFLSFSTGLFAQNCFDQISDQEILYDEDDESTLNQILTNIDCFLGEGMDETDIKIFKSNGSWIGIVIIDILNSEEKATYRALHVKLMEIVNDKEYQSSKPILSRVIDFFRLAADYSNWEKDKQLLIDAGMTAEELAEFEVYLEKNADPTKTYEEVFRDYSDNMVTNDFDTTEYELFAKQNTIDLDEVLKTSEEEMIPVILYFTGYAVANARKLEQMITDDLDIFMMLAEEFIFIPMYCDDNTPIEVSKQFYSEELEKNITTEGELALYYQLTYFKRTDQPYFVGINSNMEKLAELNFNMNPDTIVDFMDELDANFYKTMGIPDEFLEEEK